MQKSLDKLIEVEWYDAATYTDIDRKTITCSKDFFVKRTSYGKLICKDKYGIILLTDMCENNECEITAIPKYWLTDKSYNMLYKKSEKK